jgi:hypothetical protein
VDVPCSQKSPQFLKETFAELATTVLPQQMLRLRVSLKNPDAARLFAKQGEGPVAIARTLEELGRVPFWEKLQDR